MFEFSTWNKCINVKHSYLCRNLLLQDSLYFTEIILFEQRRIIFLAHGFNVVRLNSPNSCLYCYILGFSNLRYFNLKLTVSCVN